MKKLETVNNFKKGVSDGMPIGLGYLSVSFAFGIVATSSNIPIIASVLMSLTNLTSAGQFAALQIIVAGGTLIELAISQVVINLRYSLMSISLSQKLHSSVKPKDRFAIAFGITDEIFAIAMSKPGEIGTKYFLGLMLLPIIGWTGGTFLGAAASSILPDSIRVALGVALYVMFIAIVIPNAKKSKAIAAAAGIAVALSCMFTYVPFLKSVSTSFAPIISAVVASAIMAAVAPVREDGDDK